MRPIDLRGFSAKFAADPDPWSTWCNRDERIKREAILHGLPAGKVAAVLELAAGNGSNSVSLAPRSLRLDATEGTAEGAALSRAALAPYYPRARAIRLVVPSKPPRARYDAVVVAELLYYLGNRDLHRLARQITRLLWPSGRLILAHHHITFHDFAQHAADIHARFLAATGKRWHCRAVRRTRRWEVLSCCPATQGCR